MNKQELIKEFEEIGIYGLNIFNTVVEGIPTKTAIKLIKQLDEPKPVKVPQFVADFIAEQKKLGHTLSYSIDASMSDRVAEWYWDNSELFALAWIFGCEVEEEKRYLVKMKGMSEENTYLTFRFGHTWMLSNFEECEEFRLHHTRKELEKAGFGWVFNCEGIEIEKVEG
ncbi:DUF1642 domain-containing protein [Streptococcus mitis]|uniref:DUF1642 domain-containing protein n=1 Tax=Streptococcus mitis TaxID=28037 RepID=UPI00205DE6B1|nr:DUF1642 domain-containing protein [Streptococcus mitis]MCY7170111.1 DUF1642 domain-containing protein [Streptococcus mitis]DAE99110.1 MAG TPA: Protein of unknown function (DUF1642) [Caudoviricetes sp.]